MMRDPNAETITNAELIAEMRERRSAGPVTHDVCGACCVNCNRTCSIERSAIQAAPDKSTDEP